MTASYTTAGTIVSADRADLKTLTQISTDTHRWHTGTSSLGHDAGQFSPTPTNSRYLSVYICVYLCASVFEPLPFSFPPDTNPAQPRLHDPFRSVSNFCASAFSFSGPF